MKLMLVSLVVLAGLAAGIAGGVAYWFSERPEDRPPPKVFSSWPGQVAANGVIEGARPAIALRPEVTGIMTALHVRENCPVTKGKLLLEIQDGTYQQQVALMEAEVTVAKANLDRLRNGERAERRRAAAAATRARHATYLKAKAEFERLQNLRDSGSVTREQYDSGYFRLEQARASWEEAAAEQALAEAPARADEVAAAEGRIKSAEARLKLAREDLARTRLLSPCNGMILQVHAEPGEVIGPASPQPVLLMADLSRRRVRAFIEELDAPRIQVGQLAIVVADGVPGKEFTATVTEVMPRMGRRAPLTDEPGEYRDRYYREVLLDLDGGESLPLNLRVRVRIRISPAPSRG